MLNRFHNVGMSAHSRGSEIAILDIPQQGMAPCVVGTFGALFEPMTVETVTTPLVRADERLLAQLFSIVEKQLLVVVSTCSEDEFLKKRAEIWPKYVRGLRALTDTMHNLVPESDMEAMMGGAGTSLSGDLEKQRGVWLGDPLTDQAVFTLWTLGKIRALAKAIHAAGRAPAEKRGHDLELLREYRLTSLWSQFHLDIAFAAVDSKIHMPDAVQNHIIDGLRGAVNAYAVMREALSLRQPAADQAAADLPWDDEDEALLAESMRDINAFSDSGDC